MARSRKGVKFNHRGSNDQNGSRTSIAELSDAMSDPGSPLRQSMDGKAEKINEEVGFSVRDWSFDGLMRRTARPSTSIRIREEKRNIHHPDDMDIRDDRRVLCGFVFGAYIHHRGRHGHPDCILQGSHSNRAYTQPGQESAFHEIAQLVLSRDHHVFPIRGKCRVLLQAHNSG